MAAGALGGAWKAVVKFSAAAEGATVAQTIAAAATRAWGLAMDALPWVALAAAVVTVAVLIIKYHKQIWAFVQRVWDDILGVIQGVWGWVKRNWPLLLGIITGPIGLAAVFIVKHFTLVKDFIHWAWDQIQIFSLRAVKGVLDAFSHIPLIGGMFHRAASAIGGELTRIQKDSATTWARIQAGMDRVHGKKVALIFSLDLPPGVTYPSRHIKGHAAGGMATPGEMAWVGEQGPELVHFRGPATVFSNRRSRQIAGYAGGTLDSFSASFPSARGLAAAFQGAVSAIAREVRNLIGVVKVVVPGGAGVQRWAPLVLQVLRMLGQPSADIGVALRQMQTESGGNPTVVNRTDSNWLAGHPSVGLMQVIAGTFASYAGRYRNTGPFEYGVSVNPLANIFAGLNYAVHRYGAGWTRVLGQGHGYDSGGWLMPGWNPPMYNGTGRPEHLIPAARRAGQAASAQVVIRVGGTGSGTLNRALLTWLREAIHVEGGGDVQIALGS